MRDKFNNAGLLRKRSKSKFEIITTWDQKEEILERKGFIIS